MSLPGEVSITAMIRRMSSAVCCPSESAVTALDSRNKHCDASCVFPKVEQWLRGFMDADFVFTDSFHGMVFAIIFHKPFAVVANASRGLSRFESLTSLLGLGDRLVSEKERSRLPEMDRDVDFDRVEERLCGFRTVSEEFLFSALEGEI